MQTTDSTLPYAFTFTRRTKREGLFSSPEIIFELSTGNGAKIGQFSIKYKHAEYLSADGREDFRIKKSFWGTHWLYEGLDEQRFARVSIGFRHTITFANDTKYRLRVKRKWTFGRKKKIDEYTHRATFLQGETAVMLLENYQPLAFFSTDVYAPMSGSIYTGIKEARTIAGLLLLFQSYLMAGAHAAAAG